MSNIVYLDSNGRTNKQLIPQVVGLIESIGNRWQSGHEDGEIFTFPTLNSITNTGAWLHSSMV